MYVTVLLARHIVGLPCTHLIAHTLHHKESWVVGVCLSKWIPVTVPIPPKISFGCVGVRSWTQWPYSHTWRMDSALQYRRGWPWVGEVDHALLFWALNSSHSSSTFGIVSLQPCNNYVIDYKTFLSWVRQSNHTLHVLPRMWWSDVNYYAVL